MQTQYLLNSVLYSVLGIAILVMVFWIIEKATPRHNLWKEVVENKNVALALVAGLAMPAAAILFAGLAGAGAWQVRGGRREAVRARPVPAAGAVVACSRAHGDGAAMDEWLRGESVVAQVPAGSSLKFGLLACGEADLYPRLGRTMEWDIAAGQAVLVAAGGSVHTLEGLPMRYGKPGFENSHFVARGAGGAGKPRSGGLATHS